jgi:hypothetical protein
MQLEELQYPEAQAMVTDYFEECIARSIQMSTMTYAEIGLDYGVEPSFVARVAVKFHIRRPRGNGSPSRRQHGK